MNEKLNVSYVFLSDKELRAIERKVIKYFKRHWRFTTAEGKVNIIKGIDKEKIIIQTKSSNKGFKIKRQKLSKSIRYFFKKRTLIRKDLEQFTAFTSALFGLLSAAFEPIVYLKKMKDRVYRLSLIGVRFFASGLERDPAIRKVVQELGGTFLLLNYFHIRGNDYWLKMIEEEDFYVLIDSGSFSVYKRTLKINPCSKNYFLMKSYR